MRISNVFLPLVAATLLIAGCGNKAPATSAVSQAEAALVKERDNASQFAAPELAVADATLANMKANLSKEDYDAVVADIPKFNAEVKTLQAAIVSNQTLAAAAQQEWETLNKEVPPAVEAIQVRVDNLAAARLPKEISRQTLNTAKAELKTMKATWAEATAAASSGKTAEATDKGRSVQAKAEELKSKLGMNPALAAVIAPAPGAN